MAMRASTFDSRAMAFRIFSKPIPIPKSQRAKSLQLQPSMTVLLISICFIAFWLSESVGQRRQYQKPEGQRRQISGNGPDRRIAADSHRRVADLIEGLTRHAMGDHAKAIKALRPVAG